MELQEAISNRRSIKKFKHDMVIDDKALYDAVEKATDAPNHGMREPWRVVHVAKDKLGDFSQDITRFAFPDNPEKEKTIIMRNKSRRFIIINLKDDLDKDKVVKITLHLGHLLKT